MKTSVGVGVSCEDLELVKEINKSCVVQDDPISINLLIILLYVLLLRQHCSQLQLILLHIKIVLSKLFEGKICHMAWIVAATTFSRLIILLLA